MDALTLALLALLAAWMTGMFWLFSTPTRIDPEDLEHKPGDW